MSKVLTILAHLAALAAFVFGVLAVRSTHTPAWRFFTENLTIGAPSEHAPKQALTLSSDLLREADRVRSGQFEWTRATAEEAPPVLHLAPPDNADCRELAIALLREPQEKLTLKLWPLRTEKCGSQEWRLYARNKEKDRYPLSHSTPVEITFPRAEEPLELFGELQARSIRTSTLAGNVNPFGAFSRPLGGKNLVIEADSLQLLSLTIQPASRPERAVPALEVLIQAGSYEKVLVNAADQRWRWLWEWPPSPLLLLLLIPLAQVLIGLANLAKTAPPSPTSAPRSSAGSGP